MVTGATDLPDRGRERAILPELAPRYGRPDQGNGNPERIGGRRRGRREGNREGNRGQLPVPLARTIRPWAVAG